MKKRNAPYLLGLALITSLLLILFWFGMEQLQDIPPGMHPDIGENLADALRISRTGTFPLYLQTRPEPLWRFIQGFVVKWTNGVSFAGRFAGVIVTMLTAALTYQAVVSLLWRLHWATPNQRVIAGALSVSALISNVAFHFIFIQGYRALLLSCSIAFLLLTWNYALSKRTNRAFLVAGLAASIPVNTYTAGLVVPPTMLLYSILMQFVFPRERRFSRSQWGWFLCGMLLAAAPQIYLALRVPNLYSRLVEAASYGNTQQSMLDLQLSIPVVFHKLNESFQHFYAQGFFMPNYNTPSTPFLNLILTLLAALGIVVAARYWRRVSGLLIILLLLMLTLPGALSMYPGDPVRLSGTFVPLAVLSGFGIVAVSHWLKKPVYGTALCIGVGVISIMMARGSFNAHWQDDSLWQDDQYWLSFPHYYSTNYIEQLDMLRMASEPVYVPLAQVDFSTAFWYLQREAYTHIVTTGSAESLPDGSPLPDADLWYPYAAEYNVPITNPAEQFVLLLPGPDGRDGSIVILPPIRLGEADALAQRVMQEGTPLHDTRGILLGWRLPVRAANVTAPAQDGLWYPVNARFSDQLELVGYEAPRTVTPDTKTRVTLYWRVVQSPHIDLFNFAVFLDSNGNAGTPVDTWVYRWLYPSVFWQVDDVLPQVVWVTPAASIPEGLVQLGIGVYTPPDYAKLAAFDSNGSRIPLDFPILPNHRVPLGSMSELPQNALPVQAQFGEFLKLTAFSADPLLNALKAGDTLNLSLSWQTLQNPSAAYTIFIHMLDANGNIIAQQDSSPMNGAYPTNLWEANEQVVTTHQITLPDDIPDQYVIKVGFYSWPSLERLPVFQSGSIALDNAAILFSNVDG